MSLRCLFHVHTRFSFDSFLSPQKILQKAREKRADILIVTDHNTVRGSQEVSALACGNPRHVVRAAEYKTDKGDVIGMFLKEEIQFRESNQVIQEIHRQGGLALLPHPYKGHTLDDVFVGQMDLIETFNARCRRSENASAVELARKWGKPFLGGCDAHCAPEIGSVITNLRADPPPTENELRDLILSAPREVTFAAVSRVYQPYSQMIKAYKTRDAFLFLSQAKRMAVFLAKEMIAR